MKNSPCFHCPNRKGGCHCSCEDYKAYRKAMDAEKEEMRLQNQAEQEAAGRKREIMSYYLHAKRQPC